MIIDDSYNSNPISLKNSIFEFHNFKNKKNKILVLGDMFELGKFSKKKHIEVGKYLKNSNLVGFILLVENQNKSTIKLNPHFGANITKILTFFQTI